MGNGAGAGGEIAWRGCPFSSGKVVRSDSCLLMISSNVRCNTAMSRSAASDGCYRDVVDGTPWRHPIKNPELLLRERQR